MWPEKIISHYQNSLLLSAPCDSFETSRLLKVIFFFQFLYHISVKHFCQSSRAAGEGTTDTSACGGQTGHPNLVGRAAAVLKVKAEEDVFLLRLYCDNSVFSGPLTGDEGSRCSRVSLWPHFTDDQVPECQPGLAFYASHRLLPPVKHRAGQHLWDPEPCVLGSHRDGVWFKTLAHRSTKGKT